MILFPRIFVYVCFIIFDKYTFCDNSVEKYIDFPKTIELSHRFINETWTTNVRLKDLIPHLDTITDKNLMKRSISILINNSNLTIIKPKDKKPLTVFTKKPPRRFNITKPAIKTLTSANITIWPKHLKRLGNDGRKALSLKTPNKTDESIDFKTTHPVSKWENNGFYTDDYIKLINEHWFKFTPPNPLSHYILGFLYIVIMLVGCLGNLLVIIMYIKCKSLQTPANVLIMNLAVSDFFMLAKTPVFIYNSYYQGPALGKLGCEIYGFFGGLTGTASIMTLAAISLDRYYVIVHPLNAAVKTTKQRARVWIGLIWTYGFIFSVIPVLDIGYNHYVPEGYLTSCSFDYLTDDKQEKAFILVFFTAAWCIPFTVISYCYVKILSAVWTTSEMTACRYGQEEKKRKTEIRLGYVVVGVIMLWFMSWTPYAIVALLGVFGQKEYITPLNSMIPALFCKAASCIDPWIYAITHPRFKKELMKLLLKKKSKRLERDCVIRKTWERNQSRTRKSELGNYSSTDDEDVEELVVIGNPAIDKKIHRQGSTSSHKTEETKVLETKFPPTRQESLKYMPPSWYDLPRTTSKSSMLDKKVTLDNSTNQL